MSTGWDDPIPFEASRSAIPHRADPFGQHGPGAGTNTSLETTGIDLPVSGCPSQLTYGHPQH